MTQATFREGQSTIGKPWGFLRPVLAKGPLSIVLVLVVSVLLGMHAHAQPQLLPAAHSYTWLGVDLPGGDLGPVFDVNFETCRDICLFDGDCRGFTYDDVNGACFPKRSLAAPVAFDGAISGFVVRRSSQAFALAESVYENLTHLRYDDFAAAVDQAEAMSLRYAAAGFSERDWLEARKRQPIDARPSYSGAAVTVADSGDAWLAHATDLERVASTDDADSGTYRDVAAAALNAALRLSSASTRAAALVVLTDALIELGRGVDALATVEYAESLARGVSGPRLAELRNEFAFRVERTRVDLRASRPRICVTLSEPLNPLLDYAPYVAGDARGWTIEREENALCLIGAGYGESYEIVLRSGLPSATAATLARDVPVQVYVGDREPAIRFQRRSYVLPATGPRAIPIETINVPELELGLFRVAPGNYVPSIQDGTFLDVMSTWEGRYFESNIGEETWRGRLNPEASINEVRTTLVPLEVMSALEPGLYVLRAAGVGFNSYELPPVSQWFIVSDLGLTVLEGANGIHVVAQRLSTGAPIANANVTVVARSNRTLATVETNEAGIAAFPASLTRGSQAAEPVLVLVEAGADLGLLSLEEPEFDLSDRGVSGREPSGPIDTYMTTDRGVYRPGETVNVTVLLRDAELRAVTDVPITLRVTRPDGVRYTEVVSMDDSAGGHVLAVPIGADVTRGRYGLEVFADPTASALARATILVEDFLPERIDAELAFSREGAIDVVDPPTARLEARYLYGVPAGNLPMTGHVTLRPVTLLEGWPGYRFGEPETDADTVRRSLPGGISTDLEGRLEIDLPIRNLNLDPRPYELTLATTLLDAGRPVERTLTSPLRLAQSVVGVRPNFEGPLDTNAEASFTLAIVDPSGRAEAGSVAWQVDRIVTRYQWFTVGGVWNWEGVTERIRIDAGTTELREGTSTVTVPVTWGRYEVRAVLESDPRVRTVVPFSAGWFADGGSRETPDLLDVSLDAAAYDRGDVAQLRIAAQRSGTAIVSVLTDRVIDTRMVAVDGDTTVDFTVTEAWGSGAYLMASLITPGDGRVELPSRSLGIAHATVNPGARQLEVAIGAPDEVRSRAPMTVTLEVPGVDDGTLFAAIAAVDLGALTVTGFEPPNPSAFFFGQRRLGVAIRDAYGRLIDARQGAMGNVRSGGGQEGLGAGGPVALEDVLASFQGPIEVRQGRAEIPIDLPAFNGTVRLMAVAWSGEAVGQASVDVLVRDPVVVDVTMPRFLAPGDQSRIRLDVTHVTGPAGLFDLALEGPGLGSLPSTLTLGEGERVTIDVPLQLQEVGDVNYALKLTTPAGFELTRTLRLSVRAYDPPVVRTLRIELASGQDVALTQQAFEGFLLPGATSTLAVGRGAAFDLPGLVNRLVAYPYTCTEQSASRLAPLLLAPDVVTNLGFMTGDAIREEVDRLIDRIASRQGGDGSFGLWNVGGYDAWLDAYATDMLLRAADAGYPVPTTVLQAAVANLSNIVNRAGNTLREPQAFAYASYLLARQGDASVADLRYYADQQEDAFDTPLAAAHFAAALSAYGERERAERMFERAERLALEPRADRGFRDDYGTNLRDLAGVIALALEADASSVDVDALTTMVTQAHADGWYSTQEAAWMLQAGIAWRRPTLDVTLDGAPLLRAVAQLDPSKGNVLRNQGPEPVVVTLTTLGVRDEPTTEGGTGLAIRRTYHALDGRVRTLDDVRVGDRFVVALEVQRAGGRAAGRMMIDDALPAGLEIDNANLLEEGGIGTLAWLEPSSYETFTEARTERFLAAVEWTSAEPIRVAYVVRAVSPGVFHHPAALVEDMYRPTVRAVTSAGRVTVR